MLQTQGHNQDRLDLIQHLQLEALVLPLELLLE